MLQKMQTSFILSRVVMIGLVTYKLLPYDLDVGVGTSQVYTWYYFKFYIKLILV
jgi:hypothetical protein